MSRRMIFIAEIQRKVAADFRVTVDEITSNRRGRDVIWPRFAAVYLAARLTDKSLSEIGRRFGGRDHSTIGSAVARVEQRQREDREFDARLRRLTAQLRDEPDLKAETGVQLTFLHGPLFDLMEARP